MQPLTLVRRLLPVCAGAAVLSLAAGTYGGEPAALLDPRAFAVAFGLPWLLLAVTDSFTTAASTAGDLARKDLLALPAPQRRASAARLDGLGAASLAAGVVAALLSMVGAMNSIASAQGQVSGDAWAGLSAGLLLGPLYGLALKVLLYDPAATALRAASTELGEMLEP